MAGNGPVARGRCWRGKATECQGAMVRVGRGLTSLLTTPGRPKQRVMHMRLSGRGAGRRRPTATRRVERHRWRPWRAGGRHLGRQAEVQPDEEAGDRDRIKRSRPCSLRRAGRKRRVPAPPAPDRAA
jgi:hypothetical protein